MKAFLNNFTLRPICYSCPSKGGKSMADFSIADFWGVDRYCHKFNDDKGVTLLYVHTNNASKLLSSLDLESINLNPDKEYNRSYSCSAKEKYPIMKFWELYEKEGIDCITSICDNIKPSFISRLEARIRTIIKLILFRKLI